MLYFFYQILSKEIELNDSCFDFRFLWADYTVDCLYWDVIEVTRKIFLSGFIMFVDAEEGSNKVLRLVRNSFSALFF